MSRIEDSFSAIFSQLECALEGQRNLHLSAFGKEKPTRDDIITQAEDNRVKIIDWISRLRDLQNEIYSSGIIYSDKKVSKISKQSFDGRPTCAIPARFTRPRAVTVLGQFKEVRHWKDIPLFVGKILYERHPLKFSGIENEPSLQGRKSPYVSMDIQSIRKAEKIEGSPYYIEINLSRVYCIKLSKLLISYFGYQESELMIEQESDQTSEQKMPILNESGVHFKVGKRAKLGFSKLLSENILSPDDIKRLCQHDYSKKIFGEPVPTVVEFGERVSVSERSDDTGYAVSSIAQSPESVNRASAICSMGISL